MRVLAFDTSSPISAVAVVDAGRVLAEDNSGDARRHAELLLPRIAAQLELAKIALDEIELIAVGIGPGSFTGLRIGLATAKGLTLARALPLCGVCSLRVLARGIIDLGETAIVAIDAGKGELFGAVFRREGESLRTLLEPWRATAPELARRIADLELGPAIMCGSGVRAQHVAFHAALGDEALLATPERDRPMARHLAHEAELQVAARGPSEPATLEPVYLRDSDAKLPREPLFLG